MGRGRPLRRLVVIGQSGSGKTTTARLLSHRLGLRHVELDALFHGPGWEPRSSFAADVDAATTADGWVVDGNYSAVRDLVWARADTVVWLDLPRTTTLRRALLRTVRRLLTRVELWNGNRERLRAILRATHPIRMTWETHAERRALTEQRIADPAWSHLAVVRLHSSRAVRAWLDGLPRVRRRQTTGTGHKAAVPATHVQPPVSVAGCPGPACASRAARTDVRTT